MDQVALAHATMPAPLPKSKSRTAGSEISLFATPAIPNPRRYNPSRTPIRKRPWKAPKDGPKNLVFINGGQLPMHDNMIRNRLEGLLEKAELPVITLHDFRELCCVSMAEAGVPLHIASKFLGHENIATTLRWYSVARQQDMSDALGRYWTKPK